MQTVGDKACPACNLTPTGIAAAPDGSFFVSAQSERNGGTAFLLRLTPQGALAWVYEQGDAAKPAGAYGVTARADGGALFVGQTVAGGAVVPMLGWIGADKGGSGQAVDALAPEGRFEAAAERSDGSLVAVGFSPTGTSVRSLVVAYDAAGKLLWRKHAALADGLAWNNVVAGPGALFLAGTRNESGESLLELARLDAKGATVWSRPHRYLGVGQLSPYNGSLLRLADGGLVVACVGAVGAQLGQIIVRTDASGFVSCQEAGACAKLKDPGCDDSNACTADWCDAKAGCKHSNLEGLACGVGGTCGAGVCK